MQYLYVIARDEAEAKEQEEAIRQSLSNYIKREARAVSDFGEPWIHRRELEQTVAALRKGDALVVSKLASLGATLDDIIRAASRALTVGANVVCANHGAVIRTETAAGLFEMIVGAADEAKAVTRRKAQLVGRRGGRPPRLDEQGRAQANKMHGAGVTKAEICRRLRISRPTLDKCLAAARR